jgi:hypothetical protein
MMSGREPDPDGILDYTDGNWSIPNPVDRGKPDDKVENFADKWNDKSELPKAFFGWLYQLARDIEGFERSGLSDDLSLRIKRFGGAVHTPLSWLRIWRHSHAPARRSTRPLY